MSYEMMLSYILTTLNGYVVEWQERTETENYEFSQKLWLSAACQN